MNFPSDYDERVYAGWLGKCIGVRFGAPVENWTYEEIRDNLGKLTTYLREDSGKIFKPDDDTAVPMILIRALQDYGASDALTAAQLGDTLLNYIGDQHGTFWWGGYGVSTEHTAYLNLANGIAAPRSGSIAQNGAAVAEQIGGQIFSDIWGLVAPNDPARAADFAHKASSVTHDGSGVDGGRFIAALVSAAFSEGDPRRLVEIGLAQIAPDGEYAQVVRSVVDFHAANPDDWRGAYAHLKANFGYDRYPGIVHMIPNAGVVALGLLYGEGDFSRTIQITNMCGWDTDCNVGNVGAIIGTAVGLAGIDPAWREPINDVLIASSTIGTRNLLTIPQCADLFSALGRQLDGENPEPRPRYHFRYPGSTSNFEVSGEKSRPIHYARSQNEPTLQTAIRKLNKKGEIRIFTRTYYRPKELSGNYYEACFTPLIFSGQTVTAKVYLPEDAPDTITAALYVYDDNTDEHHQAVGEALTPGGWHRLHYQIPSLGDACLSEVGIVLRNLGEIWEAGSFHVAELDWSGVPDYSTTFVHERPESGGVSQWTRLRGYWRLEDGAYHGGGPGLCESYSGDIRWTDYTMEAEVVPLAGEHHQVNVRVGGSLRSYAFGLAPDGQIAIYKKDREYKVAASAPFAWTHGTSYRLSITANGDTFTASVYAPDGKTQSLSWRDTESPYLNGQIGLSSWNGGHTRFQSVRVHGIGAS
jgi:ADP-ribosylglycohydrolase